MTSPSRVRAISRVSLDAPSSLTYRELAVADCSRAADFFDRTDDKRCDVDIVGRTWPTLLEWGTLKAAYVENAEGEIISLGASVFITDRLARELVGGAEPFVTARLMRDALEPNSAIVGRAQIGRANGTTGLTVFILYSGILAARPLDRGQTAQRKAQMMSGFIDLHAGYNIVRLVVEAFGEEEKGMYVDASGFSLHNSYPDRTLREPRPYLVGLTREEVWRMHMHPLLPFFRHYPLPRLGFSSAERALLQKAVHGSTDDALADELGIRLSAVKQRWVRIFNRSESLGLELVSTESRSRDVGRRGRQKRHILLRYLRRHPEELVPFTTPADASDGDLPLTVEM